MALHNIRSAFSDKVPQSYGAYPNGTGVAYSHFVHLLPYLEQENVYRLVMAGGAGGTTASIKTFAAPNDASNPGNLNGISYNSNSSLFGVLGMSRGMSATLSQKGESNTIAYAEVYATYGTLLRTWPSVQNDTYLAPTAVLVQLPNWSSALPNTQAHSYGASGCQVCIADGSVRSVAPSSVGWPIALNVQNSAVLPGNW